VWTVTRIGNDKIRREEYVRARGRFIIMNLIAAISFISYPCAPPRIMPDAGFIDTLGSVTGVDVYSSTRRWVNPYAAMPSMHMGYSLLFTITTIQILISQYHRSLFKSNTADNEQLLAPELPKQNFSKNIQFIISLLPFLALFYPAFMFFVIISTANHFILDAIAGATAFLLALGFYEVIILVWEKIQKARMTKNNNNNNNTMDKDSEGQKYVSINVGVEMVQTNTQQQG